MNKIYIVSFLIILISLKANAQKFKLPEIPKYDSVYIDSYNDKIKEKSYFLNSVKVFQIGYNTGDVLYSPFSTIGGAKEDSCYAYFSGKNHDNYDFYYMAQSYIINNRYAETSKIFNYSKFTWDKKPIESGSYYFIKEMWGTTITHYKKYKTGKWIVYDSIGLPLTTIDYDKYTINNKPLQYSGQMAIIPHLKDLAAKKIIAMYGKDFFTKYVRFNLDRSGYYSLYKPGVDQPGGFPFSRISEQEINTIDLSYDILLGEERFNVIQFRVLKDGTFLGLTYRPDYRRYYNFCMGLDSLNNKKLHNNVINWKEIAVKKGLDPLSKDFNIKFTFKPTSDFSGELRLVLEQIVQQSSTKHSQINTIKQYIINPWTGAITETSTKDGTVSVAGSED